jgi:hypothetical protein
MTRPKDQDNYTVPLRSSNGDGGVPWGRIAELKIREAPIPRTRQAKWDALYRELMLRLEQTDSRHVLAVPMKEPRLVTLAARALRWRFEQVDPDFVEITTTSNPPVLYIKRGPNWSP